MYTRGMRKHLISILTVSAFSILSAVPVHARVESFSLFPERVQPSFVERVLNRESYHLLAQLAYLADDTHSAYQVFQDRQERQPYHATALHSLGSFFFGIQ